MTISSEELLSIVAAYLWPLFRIAALVSAAPVFGTRVLPMRLKVIFVLALTAAIAPSTPPPPDIEMFSLGGIMAVLQQMLIGVAMGFSLHLVFGAFVFAGQVVALGMGLGFASLNDPSTGVVVPTVSQFYTIMITLLFFTMNGHLIMIGVLAKSFHTMPISASGIEINSLWMLLSWTSNMFSGAVLIALPAIASMLIVNVGFGVMTRASPQLNIFAIGFPVIMAIGFFVILASLPNIPVQFESLIGSGFELMRVLTGGS